MISVDHSWLEVKLNKVDLGAKVLVAHDGLAFLLTSLYRRMALNSQRCISYDVVGVTIHSAYLFI